MSFSAGIALAPRAGTSLEACTKAADIALYRAKISGRNRDIVWGEHLEDMVREGMGGPGKAGGHDRRDLRSGYKAAAG